MKNKKPEIRFKGFSEDWEERSLKGITSDISDGDWIETNHIFSEGEYRIIQTGNLGLGEYLDKSNNAKFFHQKDFDEIKANEIFPNDILISRLAEPAGRTIILPETGYRMVTAVDVTIIRPDEDSFNSIFLMTQLNSENVLQVINENVSGTSHRRISRRNLEKTKLAVPILSEQTQIGNFFKNLDSLITLHQQKYEKLGILKKAMLEKMFPKNGKNVPEIRFKGFSGAWEEKELSCIVSRVSCISNKVGLPRVEYEDIVSGKGELNKNIEQKNSRKIGIEFEIGDVLYGKLRPYLNNWLLPTFQGIAVGDFWVFRPNETNSKFIFYLIQTSDYEKIANQSSGSKMPRADWNLMSNAVFFIPLNKNEQEKIGNYFKNLDKLLTLHQGELGKLKNLKKAMLEKMFV